MPGDILFDFDKSVLRASALPSLRVLAKIIMEEQPADILIRGHTDSKGDESYNLQLGQRRADAVAQALTQRFGIDDGRLKTESLGEGAPVAPNVTPEGRDNPIGRQKNRRVEVLLRR
ncbi:OmpA family protein [Marivita hallyeonensis]|uniref:OmpA family protein n=1 Tax=Marivita hallyeonensis TaxID=996342 RepID=UPI001C49EF4D|nr:OmpA family protein [Marivita hallyeonensis]